MQLEELVDLTRGDVEASLWHPAHATLWVAGAVHVDAVDVGRLVGVLEVADGRVTFSAQVDQVRVWVVEGKEDAVAVVQLFHAQTGELFIARVDFVLQIIKKIN